MKLNTGMRCYDLCSKMEMEKSSAQVREYNICQVQLTFGKSISDYGFTTGHCSSRFARTTARGLEKDQIHVAMLGCYTSPISPVESRCQAEVARFIEHMKYARVIGADMAGTEAGRLDPNSRVTEESYMEDAYRLLLKSMREIVAVARKLGVIMGVEGVFNHTLYSPARMKRFSEDIDSLNVEVILDAVNLTHSYQVEPKVQEQVIDRTFVHHGDRIGTFHVKDSVFDNQERPSRHVGDGFPRYEPLMKHVKERKPHITMLLENFSRECYHEDVKFLQRTYDRA